MTGVSASRPVGTGADAAPVLSVADLRVRFGCP